MPLAARPPVASPARSAFLPLVLVFLCGVTVGALAMSLGWHKSLRHTPTWSQNGKPITLQKWKKDLDLTEDQTRQIETILDDFSRLYDNVLADGNTRILQILDERQKKKFEQMIKDAAR
jgi:hypothetical protein